MWRKMSLRMRLNLSLGIILTLGLCIAVGTMIVNAGPRVRAEDDSSVRLAKEVVETAVPTLTEMQDATAALHNLMRSLKHLRHVNIFLAADPTDRNTWLVSNPPHASKVPAWFVALVPTDRTFLTVPVDANGVDYGEIVIASNPIDEIGEVWMDVRSLTFGGLALILTLLLANILLVNRALAPVAVIAKAMGDLEEGDYRSRIAVAGPPELGAICGRVNSLAAALEEATSDNRRLAEKIITLQDDERKELARELHDEFGASLFSIRAHATSLAKAVDRPDFSARNIRGVCTAMVEQIDALQKVNRRLLGRLRPVAYGDLGLKEALRALVAMWRGSYPGIEVNMAFPERLDSLDETIGLTVYRIVQEGLTNVFRHASATQVDVAIDGIFASGQESAGETIVAAPLASMKSAEARKVAARPGAGTRSVRIRVRDNGVGLPPARKQGFGLLGMGERVWALRGHMRIDSLPEGGVMLEAELPLA